MWGELKPLGPEELRAVDEALTSDDGALLNLMADVGIGLPPTPSPAVDIAQALGWIQSGEATAVGLKVADSCREYRFWEERDRRMPPSGIEDYTRESLRGRSVVELGSGFGCNLLSLQGYASELVGVEIEPIYRQLSPILAKKAGLTPPEIVGASAEKTGLESGRFEVVLCIGSLQYMPIVDVLKEMFRLLAPGGHAMIHLSHFEGHVVQLWRERKSARLRELYLLPAMLTYPYLGRALMRPSDHVYPTHRTMRRWLEGAGFEPVRLTVTGHETFYDARRPD